MANVTLVCAADHGREAVNNEGPTITVTEGKWAFCLRGGAARHVWVEVPPTDADVLRTHRIRAPKQQISLEKAAESN